MDLFKSSVKDVRITNFMQTLFHLVGSWGNILQDILESDMMYCTLEEVFESAWSGKKVLPVSGNILRAFKECSYGDLKVVFIGQDPYHQIINNTIVADGLAFSCGNTLKEQPSLKFILDEVQKTAYHYNFTRNPDLTRWANQGILLLNTALTVEQGSPDSHTNYWKEFITSVLERIEHENDNLIFVFFGKRAQSFEKLISTRHHKVNVIHPAAAAHRGGVWDSEGIFPHINILLKESLKKEIIW